MDQRAPEMLKPTLLAGVLFGVLGGLPFINVLNCFCCSLVIACGFVASYLYSTRCNAAGVEFRPGKGALVGLIAGAVYAVVVTFVGGVFEALIGNPAGIAILEWVQQIPEIPPESQDMLDDALDQMREGGFSFFRLVLGFFEAVLIGAIFSTIGGLIGGAIFKVEVATPPPPAGPPPYSGS